MRNLFLIFLLCGAWQGVFAQNFYYQPFPDSIFPAGWIRNDSRVMLLNNATSSGYSSSPTSPPASGGFNVIFQHCAPNGSNITLTVSGVINATGKSDIRVGFGLRKTNAWDRAMAFEWSSDGATWNLIDSDVSAGIPFSTWSSTYYDLPPDADNVANLRFRFSFSTNTNDNCTAPPNFRIDDFIVGENFSLPVEWANLTARLSGRTVQLAWTTATETNNDHFRVERSADGLAFAEIGRVAGAGTVREARNYQFVDEHPLAGANYYRLQQVDFDGRATFSPVRRVTNGTGAQVRLFPSPARDYVYLEWREPADSETAWTILDGNGRLLLQGFFDVENTSAAIPVHQLPAGAYWLRLTSARTAWSEVFCKR